MKTNHFGRVRVMVPTDLRGLLCHVYLFSVAGTTCWHDVRAYDNPGFHVPEDKLDRYPHAPSGRFYAATEAISISCFAFATAYPPTSLLK